MLEAIASGRKLAKQAAKGIPAHVCVRVLNRCSGGVDWTGSSKHLMFDDRIGCDSRVVWSRAYGAFKAIQEVRAENKAKGHRTTTEEMYQAAKEILGWRY